MVNIGKRGIFLIVSLLGITGLAACGATGAAKIELATEAVDLGRMVNGEIREFSVEILNTGTMPLQIEAVTTSCGCTSAAVEPEVIDPGQRGTLAVSYDSGAHGSDFTGSVTRHVYVASNDPDEREVVLELHVEVVLP